MKYLIYNLFLFIPLFSFSQNCEMPTNSNGDFEIKKTINVKGISQEKLYSSAIIALVDIERQIEFKDKDEGIILTKIITNNKVRKNLEHFFTFRLRIEIKEERYRLILHYSDHFTEKKKFANTDINDFSRNEITCSCINNIVEEKCGTKRCVTNKHWKIQKCTALEKAEQILIDLQEEIVVNYKNVNEDW